MKTVTRYIPENSTPVTRGSLPAIVYSYTDSRGQLAAISYLGKSGKKVWHYIFRSEEQRQARINQFFDGVQQREQFKATRRDEKKAYTHHMKVGDFLYASWGYEQTNIDFYQITATTEKTVTFREVQQTRTRTGHDTGTCAPIRDLFATDSREYTRKVQKKHNDEGGYVTFSEYEGGMKRYLWEVDRPEYQFSDGH